MAYQYLFEPEIQYQTKDGRNNTAGFLRVYLAATDDPATTYSDFGGTMNPQDIILDDDGRAVVIVDDSKAYRLEVYDREGMLLFTCQPITAVGGGSGSANIVQVVSTDGTVNVTKTTAAGITTYDLSTAFEPEAARWARRTGASESLIGDEDWHELETFAEIGSTAYFNGWKLSKDCAYDLAASMEMPAGYDGAINTISVKFVVEKDGVLQDVQFGHVDPTTNMDRVSFEFKGAGLAGEKINARLFYRTRQDIPIALESEVFYNEEADSITGGGGLGDLTAGDYIEITEDHVINATGIQPEITWSYDNTTISAINGSAVGRRYDGIYPIVVDNNQNTVAVDHTGLAVDETMTAYNSADHIVIGVASGQFQPSGSYLSSNALDGISGAWNEVSAKLDSSASGQFYPSSNPSGFITGVDLSPYQKTADMSAYAHESSLSAKLDASASGEFYSTSNPSGFLTAHQSLAGYATEAYVDSSVSSKLDTTAFSTVSGDFLTSHQSLAGYATESYVDSAVSGKLDVTASSQFLTSLPDDLAYTSDVASAVSGKMDKSESSSFYPMDSNPSGYLTAHQSLAGYATETYVDSAVSGKLDATAYDSAEFYTTANPSGFIDAASASAIASAYQVVSATATQLNAGTAYLTSVNDTPISAARAGNAANASLANSAWYDGTGRMISSLPDEATVSSIASAYAESAASGKLDATAQVVTSTGSASAVMMGGTSYYASQINGLNISAQKAYVADEWMHAGDKLDASASSSFYSTANESGYVDSAYVESQVSSKQDTLTFDWDADSAISSINGSALAGQGGGGSASIPFNGYYYDSATSATVEITADVSAVSSMAYVKHDGTVVNTYKGIYDTMGINHLGVASFVAPGAEINGKNAGGIPYTMSFAPGTSMWTTADAATGIFSPLQYGTGAGMFMDNSNFKGYLKGNEWFVSNTIYGYVRGEVHQGRGSRVIVEHTGGAGAVLSAKNTQANVTLNSTAYGTAQMAVANSQAYVQVQRSNHNSKYNSAKLDTDYLKFYNGMATGYLDPEDTASGTSYLPAETEYMYISSIPYWNAKMDSAEMSAYVAKSAYDDLYSAFTALSGVISTYSAYFSSISSKVDNSAIGVIE